MISTIDACKNVPQPNLPLDALPLEALPLEVRALHYSVADEILLRDIELLVESPQITMVLGHNGAGKSLLLRVLHGLLPPGQGTVKWNGIDVARLMVRKNQAMVFQKPVVLRRSVAANIDYILALRGIDTHDARDELLRSANLHSKARQAATSLSGGEQQRLAIARALATGPSVLFLDEPTASMDPAATAAIEQQIKAVANRGIKIFMVTHDIGQARRLAHDIIFLHHGEVTEHTGAAEFFDHPCSSAASNYLDRQL